MPNYLGLKVSQSSWMQSCLVWSIRVKLVCEWLCFFWEMKSITFTVCSFYLQLVCLND
jgi:hypothetical protein